MAVICTGSTWEFVKIIMAKMICTMAAICTIIVQIDLAPKWHHYLLQNLY
jgi:hypothetical protein